MSEQKYLSDKQFSAIMEHFASEDMTTGAVIGYMIMAAQALGIDRETIQDMESMMREKMDFYTTQEADKVYCNF